MNSLLYDAVLSQTDVNPFQRWCNDIDIQLNIKNCKITCISLKNNTIRYDYVINNITITKANKVNDLSIIFYPKHPFNAHIDVISNKSLSTLDFIKCTYKDFHDDIALKLLYFSLVRSHLEYTC